MIGKCEFTVAIGIFHVISVLGFWHDQIQEQSEIEDKVNIIIIYMNYTGLECNGWYCKWEDKKGASEIKNSE